MTHINHIREMSTATIQHDAKDIEVLTGLIEHLFVADLESTIDLNPEQNAALERLHHKFKTARPDMIF